MNAQQVDTPDAIGDICPCKNAGRSQKPMEENSLPSAEMPVHNQTPRFIDLVNLHIKIIIDYIPACRYENGSKTENKEKPIGQCRFYVIISKYGKNQAVAAKPLCQKDKEQIERTNDPKKSVQWLHIHQK